MLDQLTALEMVDAGCMPLSSYLSLFPAPARVKPAPSAPDVAQERPAANLGVPRSRHSQKARPSAKSSKAPRQAA
ncbi:MAG: hypothetical protein QOC72_1102 [Methylobacteriaceae bacterium]|jgi:hypothetical protein|nr:hypothetical protein [Methylobacteriaceae bacterium]